MLSQDIVTLSRSTEALKISRIITRKTAKRVIKKAITGVVPQPGETFPYSEFSGFRRVPRLVTELVLLLIFVGLLYVAIKKIINLHALQKDLEVFSKGVQILRM
jgi:hypothetical protein